MTEFAFKRGPVMPSETWAVTLGGLEGPSGKRMALKDVSKAHFAYSPQQRLTIAQLILVSPEQTIKLQCNAARGSESHRGFAGLLEAVLVELKHERPDVMFTPPPANQIAGRAAQVIGGLIALYGLYFVIVLGVMAGSGFGIGMGVGIVAVGAFMAWAFGPVPQQPKTLTETMEEVTRSYRL